MIIHDTDKEYFAHEYLSRSDIANLNRSYRYFLHKKNCQRSETKDMRIGSAVHCLILEPENFDKRFAVWDGVRKGKAYDAFSQENAGKSILNASENEDVMAMVESIPEEIALKLQPCAKEVSVYNDQLKLKCRIDAYDEKEGVIYDLKTISNIYEAEHHGPKFAYHIQAALYGDLMELETFQKLKFVFLFIDKETNFWFERDYDDEAIEFGRKQIERGVEIFKTKTTFTARETMSLPAYYLKKQNELMSGAIL
jgi:exodeoxyribonuclease VIII